MTSDDSPLSKVNHVRGKAYTGMQIISCESGLQGSSHSGLNSPCPVHDMRTDDPQMKQVGDDEI
jgi:hypothetical protein